MVVYEIVCDKCGGKVIDHVEKPKIEYEKIKASDYAKQNLGPKILNAVHHYTQHKLICTECGHIERYSV